jgi:hypothetical protein
MQPKCVGPVHGSVYTKWPSPRNNRYVEMYEKLSLFLSFVNIKVAWMTIELPPYVADTTSILSSKPVEPSVGEFLRRSLNGFLPQQILN